MRKSFEDRLADYLSSDGELTPTMEGVELAEHDRKYHFGCYDPDTQSCDLRKALERGDVCDLLAAEKQECLAKASTVKSAVDFLFSAPPVAEISGEEFKPDGRKLTEKIPAFFEERFGGMAVNPELGQVKLDKTGVQDDIAHGIGRVKAASFAAAHDVIENGIVYNKCGNWKGRGWKTAVIGAPITIDGEPFICECVVKETAERQGLYLHEVESMRKADVACGMAVRNNGGKASRLVIAKLIDEVKDCFGDAANR